ncbi:MAG TPA: 50S ribosomal protein L22 [Methylomirabilota bacterium]|jgi:large subunit ribosomal protein L22|nr:50S ribosomal protein L22 [Methylomirabilota bacterium]
MEARAVTRNVRISPQKARLVADLIRGKQVDEALLILRFTQKKAARILAKTLRSAIANATDTQSVDPDALYVKRTFVDGGATIRRFTPRAHGRATPIRKRTSHFTIVVDER